MIITFLPAEWRDLQAQVAQILEECGLAVEIEKDIETGRGTVNVDVYAQDATQKPISTYLCECKYWRSAVPKNVVHAFRTVVSDYGANCGIIISSGGFQKGAYEAAANSNILLVDWEEFQELFVDRWINQYMVPRIHSEADPLVEYTELFNSRIFRKADALSPESKERFKMLRIQYCDLAFFALHLYVWPDRVQDTLPGLPLNTYLDALHRLGAYRLPEDVLDAASLREFLDALCNHLGAGVAEFDKVFGGRA